MKIRSRAALSRMDQTFPPTVIQELEDLEVRLGGRQQIVGMLVLAPLTPDLRYVLGLLGTPDHQSTPLATICALGNVLPGKLLELLAGAVLLRGRVQASQKIGEGIAAVAEDVMRRAAPYEDACSSCRGTGSITADPTPDRPNPSPAPCDTCQGMGRLRYAPDLDRQKLAIDMAQLLPKSGGLQIAVQQNSIVGASGGGTIEKLQALTDRLLYGERGEAEGAGEEEESAESPTPSAPSTDPVVDAKVLPGA